MKVCGESGESEGCVCVCRRNQPAVQMIRYSPDLGLERCFERRIGGCEGRYLGNTHFSPLNPNTLSTGILSLRNRPSKHSIDHPAPYKACTRGSDHPASFTTDNFDHRRRPLSFPKPLLCFVFFPPLFFLLLKYNYLTSFQITLLFPFVGGVNQQDTSCVLTF